MRRRDDQYNPKRSLISAEQAVAMAGRLAACATAARYTGNPEHKRKPGDFGLTPPAAARRGKTLCDDIGLFKHAAARDLIRQGLRRGLVDGRWGDEPWPKNVWAVTADGCPVEAQSEGDGAYHGYPMPEADPFRAAILQRWQQAQ